ncbi:hypothetical protein BHE74_00058659 [Ensete ventricosum]|nr:hypothetical protein BHE74_00058659 [Ensete ventricosum]
MSEKEDGGNDRSGYGITAGSSTMGKERDIGGQQLHGCRRQHRQVLGIARAATWDSNVVAWQVGRKVRRRKQESSGRRGLEWVTAAIGKEEAVVVRRVRTALGRGWGSDGRGWGCRRQMGATVAMTEA